MTETTKAIRLASMARKLNVGIHNIVEHLHNNGFEDVDERPTTKLTPEMQELLLRDFREEIDLKNKADQVNLGLSRQSEDLRHKQEETPVAPVVETPAVEEKPVEEVPVTEETAVAKETTVEEVPVIEEEVVEEEVVEEEEVFESPKVKLEGPKKVGQVDLTTSKKEEEKASEKADEEVVEVVEEKVEVKSEEAVEEKVEEIENPDEIKTKKIKLTGPKTIGKIELPVEPVPKKKQPVASSDEANNNTQKRKRRKRIFKTGTSDRAGQDRSKRGSKKTDETPEVSAKQIQDKIKATMAKLGGASKSKSSRSKLRKAKRDSHEQTAQEEEAIKRSEDNIIEVTEFISVSELASLLDASVPDIISKCMSLGVIVSINQRLDAEIIELVSNEFEYEVKFIDVDEQLDAEEEVADDPANLEDRAPIVTIMGHVDHGKTSLLDYIREANVAEGEAGGITQHIGAYEVTTESGKKVVFLDTPGHEAFTAMRARGAKVTDVAVIIVAADDAVMPQTKEAISHAQAAGVPMVFAINKIDKDGANPKKIKEQLSMLNLLVEDWGGKFQSQDISAKTGTNVDQLFEKILLESELLELKANPNRHASGTVIEASLDKGRGFVTKILVQNGSLAIGDMILAGFNFGKVKAMFNEKGQNIKNVGPSTPVLVLGLNGAPQAGETFKVIESEQEAKSLAAKREQIIREQGIRASKHITLDEIGRRLALGNFKELNLIVKGDVDGSIEALSDSLLKLSTDEVQVNIVHKAVGQITESDVLLATASDAIIVGFQVRPSSGARKIAETEQVEIRLYSIIYDAIEEVKSAMEGLLEPKIEENIIGNVEIHEVYKISKVGTIAGCLVTEGKITRNSKIRLVREGIVVFTGELASLKRFKDDAKEVTTNMECGLNIKNYNDIKEGDIVEAFEEVEVQRTLS